jgi:hypothetical protein
MVTTNSGDEEYQHTLAQAFFKNNLNAMHV